MRYYLIAGEASGDLHAANLVKQLLNQDTDADIRAWGGDLMTAAGANVVKHYRELAFMGFVEVILNLRTILSNMRFCKQDISQFKPDVLVLVDYPGFNLRIAAWAKAQNIKVVYYISPQIWAWNQSRVHKIKQIVDKMLCILPFEPAFYKKYEYESEYVGHPLLDAIPEIQPTSPLLTHWQKPVIALLAGSRKQEVRKMLTIMLSVAPHFPDYQFVIAGAPSLERSFYADFIQQFAANSDIKNIDFVENQTYDLLRIARAALVASGTATLEVALFQVPEVVCYRGHALSMWLARKLIDLKYISLVNLIMDKQIVTELIQNDCNTERLCHELSLLLNEKYAATMQENYIALRKILQSEGDSSGEGASVRAAKAVVTVAKN
jgi:lipid-A-disaccharide synthase